jgi:hypothetical protein
LGLPTGHLYLGCPTKSSSALLSATFISCFYSVMLITHVRYDGNSVPLCKIWAINGRDWLIDYDWVRNRGLNKRALCAPLMGVSNKHLSAKFIFIF